jgi:hypothetical protein
MIQVSIKKQEQITNQASFQSTEEAQAWYDSHLGMGSFGEHEAEFKDISAEKEQEKINVEAQAFLDSTDWMVVRALEKGEELSPEFKAERQAARDSIVKG